MNLTIKAQGYFPHEVAQDLERGVTQIEINLERDPYGLLPGEVCAPGQKVLYIEDFQDGEAQGWSEQIKFKAMGWDIVPHPESEGNLVLVNAFTSNAGAELENAEFEGAVWKFQFMKDGNQINRFEWRTKYDYMDETGHVDHSTYSARFESNPEWLAIQRQKNYHDIPLLSIDFYLKRNEWHQVDIATFQGRFDFWVNSRVLVSFKDPDPLPSGTMMIGIDEVIGPEQTTYFDNLVVCELTEPYDPLSETE